MELNMRRPSFRVVTSRLPTAYTVQSTSRISASG
jgi:hypothetical protein